MTKELDSAQFNDLLVTVSNKLSPNGGWVYTGDLLPPDKTPVLIIRNGEVRIGERRWEHPSFEDTYKAFWYWDDPTNDGQIWEYNDEITHWMPIPPPVSIESYCLGNGELGCDGCAQEKNWMILNTMPDVLRKKVQEHARCIDDTDCILGGREWYRVTFKVGD